MTVQQIPPKCLLISRAELRIGDFIACGGHSSIESVVWQEQILFLKRPLPHFSKLERQHLLQNERDILCLLDKVTPQQKRLIACMGPQEDQLEGLLLRPIHGMTLTQLLRRHTLSPAEIAYIWSGVLQELCYAWQVGLKGHGDLSPSNIIIDEQAHIWCIDWGSLANRDTQYSQWEIDQFALAKLLFMLTTGQRFVDQASNQVSNHLARDLEKEGWPRTWAYLMEDLSQARLKQTDLNDQRMMLWTFSVQEKTIQNLELKTKQQLVQQVKKQNLR